MERSEILLSRFVAACCNFAWFAVMRCGTVVNIWVSFRLKRGCDGTRVFDYSGFDVCQPWSEQVFKGAEFGWANMLGQLADFVAGLWANYN